MDGQQMPGEWQYEQAKPQKHNYGDWASPLLGLGLGALLNKRNPLQGALMGGLPLAFPLLQQMMGGSPYGRQPMQRRRWVPSQAPQQQVAPQAPAVQMQAPPQQPVGY